MADKEISLDGLIRVVEEMNRIHDPLEGWHGRHTAEMALQIAELVDVPPELVRPAGMLHDIGKIFIPEHVLNKQGELTDLEWNMIQRHTIMGAQAFRAYGSLAEIEQAILYHHENFDGSGYPAGLKGEAIPVLARLIRVVDSYDALKSPRAYRDAFSTEEALLTMEQHREWFDPKIFETFKQSIGK